MRIYYRSNGLIKVETYKMKKVRLILMKWDELRSMANARTVIAEFRIVLSSDTIDLKMEMLK